MRLEMRDGLPTTAPIATAQEAIDAINDLFRMAGYKEGQGDLWLGHTLDRLKEFLGDPNPFVLPTCPHLNIDEYQGKCDDCSATLTLASTGE